MFGKNQSESECYVVVWNLLFFYSHRPWCKCCKLCMFIELYLFFFSWVIIVEMFNDIFVAKSTQKLILTKKLPEKIYCSQTVSTRSGFPLVLLNTRDSLKPWFCPWLGLSLMLSWEMCSGLDRYTQTPTSGQTSGSAIQPKHSAAWREMSQC